MRQSVARRVLTVKMQFHDVLSCVATDRVSNHRTHCSYHRRWQVAGIRLTSWAGMFEVRQQMVGKTGKWRKQFAAPRTILIETVD